MTHIAVVDHGAGNLVSICQGLERSGAEVRLATRPIDLLGAAGIVLPGVGATATVMHGIRSAGFEDPLRGLGVPLLGICVGMQVLFETSAEDGTDCLALIPGSVEQLRRAPRLPHIGWNDLEFTRDDPLFAGLPPVPTVYFVHSYAPVPAGSDVVTATTEYGSRLTAAVRQGDVAGVQFHPERSGRNGLTVLANFVRTCRVATHAA